MKRAKEQRHAAPKRFLVHIALLVKGAGESSIQLVIRVKHGVVEFAIVQEGDNFGEIHFHCGFRVHCMSVQPFSQRRRLSTSFRGYVFPSSWTALREGDPRGGARDSLGDPSSGGGDHTTLSGVVRSR